MILVVPDVQACRVLSFIFVLLGPLANLLTPHLVAKYGNKYTMIRGGLILVPVLAIMSISSHADTLSEQGSKISSLISFIIIISVSAYNFVFSATLGPCPWVYLSSYILEHMWTDFRELIDSHRIIFRLVFNSSSQFCLPTHVGIHRHFGLLRHLWIFMFSWDFLN